MRAIITGGSGVIGWSTSAKFLAGHNEVYVLSRNPDKYRNKLLNGVQLVQWDGKTGDGWSDLIDENTVIINLAGASIAGEKIFPPQRWTEERKDLIRSSRLDAGAAVVDAVQKAEHKPTLVIQSSAVGYYGIENGDEILTEAADHDESFLSYVCLAWEKSTEALEEMGVRRAVVRTGVVLSNRGGAFPNMVMPFKFFAGGPLGSGNQWVSWVHNQDVARAFLHLTENEDLRGTFNLTAPEPVRNYQLARAIGKAMGRPAFVQTPAFPLKMVFGELAQTITEGQRAVPQALLDNKFEFTYPDPQSACDELVKD